MDMYQFDADLGDFLICGVDEAGRGPLAGDVIAAAVILDRSNPIDGINDSKKLSSKKRELLYDKIIENALSYGIGVASVKEIDQINILNATFLAMLRAVQKLHIRPQLAIVDGNHNPTLGIHSKCFIKGDGKSASIAAASILAKVFRDRYMIEMSRKYTQYQFNKHKGYPTKLHYELIHVNGLCEIHRKSFLNNILLSKHSYNLGKQGEIYATNQLVSLGYQILDQNYLCEHGELDIICKNMDTLICVEVKTRTKGCLQLPCEAVNQTKKTKLINTAMHYITKFNMTSYNIRFDVVSIISSSYDKLKVIKYSHIKNAFNV